MSNLSIADRGHHTITITMNGGEKTFKIPTELSVSEVERILELQSKLEAVAEQAVKGDGEAQIRTYWGYITAQVTVILRHYQPDIDEEYVRTNFLQSDLPRILDFFASNRYVASAEDLKKKP